MKLVTWILAVLLFACDSTGSLADVESSTDQGFSVKTTVKVPGSPEEVWGHLLMIGSWWSSQHSWSGDAANLSITAEPGGRFEEKLPDGGFVRYMDVVYCHPGKMLRMTGALGPLQESAVQGTMTIVLKQDGDATTITMTYHVGGYYEGGLKKIAPLVDQVLTEQFQRLVKRIDGTLPDSKK